MVSLMVAFTVARARMPENVTLRAHRRKLQANRNSTGIRDIAVKPRRHSIESR